MNGLQRAFELFPVECRAQNRVSIDDRLPGLLQRRNVELPLKPTTHLLAIDARLGAVERVEEHALLHWRERVEVFERSRGGDQSVESRLVEPCQRIQRQACRRSEAGRRLG